MLNVHITNFLLDTHHFHRSIHHSYLTSPTAASNAATQIPEENPITTTKNPPSLNSSASASPLPPDPQDQAAPQQKSNVHKKLEAFLHAQTQSMTDSTSTPKVTSSESQAQPFDDEIPGGLVSLPQNEGEEGVCSKSAHA